MNKTKTLESELVIITGFPSDIAKAYRDYYSNQPNTRCVPITRRDNLDKKYPQADLLDKNKTAAVINSLDLNGIEEILLIHPVGKFKFEDQKNPIIDLNNDGIDDEVYDSNVRTFVNVFQPLYKRLSGKKIKIVQFGSISDKPEYDIPMWRSYSESKNKLRYMLKQLTSKKNISGVFINLSSVITSAELKTRPYADTTYWITPQEIVERSIPTIESATGYSELSLFKPSPEYHKDYFRNHDAIYEKWQREMYGNNIKQEVLK